MEYAPVLRTARIVHRRATTSSAAAMASITSRSNSSRALVCSARRGVSSVDYSSWTQQRSQTWLGGSGGKMTAQLDSVYNSSGAWRRRAYSVSSAERKSEGGDVARVSGGGARLETPEHLDEQEKVVFELLRDQLEPVELFVKDISGGCGSMYGIDITSEKFRGLNMLKQQRLVNSVLGDLIKGWHGVQLKTKAP
ncbi:bola protein [Xylogone sp. PMI_703]|nr:bola protein [Xylogone sp. PMI_703]